MKFLNQEIKSYENILNSNDSLYLPAKLLEIYNQQAEGWWDPGSRYFKSLQSITPYRLAQIKSWFGEVASKIIVDVGCGGGLISVPLIQSGAKVVAFDISAASLQAAHRMSA